MKPLLLRGCNFSCEMQAHVDILPYEEALGPVISFGISRLPLDLQGILSIHPCTSFLVQGVMNFCTWAVFNTLSVCSGVQFLCPSQHAWRVILSARQLPGRMLWTCAGLALSCPNLQQLCSCKRGVWLLFLFHSCSGQISDSDLASCRWERSLVLVVLAMLACF